MLHSPNSLAALQPRPHAVRPAVVGDVGRGTDAGAGIHLKQQVFIHENTAQSLKMGHYVTIDS